jgi:phosphatidylethanolamine-binding protein (PEBP) family uncharacterized protein
MPPPSHGPHHYHFHLHAAKTQPDLPAGMDKDEILARIKGSIRDEGELVGVYKR